MLPLISVDDHLVEPPHVFEGRLPSALAALAPKVVTDAAGNQAWEHEGTLYPNVGLNAVAGRTTAGGERIKGHEPARFEDMLPSCWDVHARIKDMDVDGVWASLNFPSMIAGFAGGMLARSKNQDLGLGLVRAWNDWCFDEWYSPYPDRIIPLAITWLNDPLIAAAEVRRNAERGFRALSFPEFPARMAGLELPSLRSGHWDPVLAACEETETVICLHVGASGWYPFVADDATFDEKCGQFSALALLAANNWIWSGVFQRFPNLKVAMSEGGLGWVPMLGDRLDYIMTHSTVVVAEGNSWTGDVSPREVLARNFWFCVLDDPHTVDAMAGFMGLDHVMYETDFPHADSTWPHSQKFAERNFGHLPEATQRAVFYGNAARLFRHPEPPAAD